MKWGFWCVPRGTKKFGVVKREDKCGRCRQTDRRCSHTLPCEWCVKNKLVCKPSLGEEKEAREVMESERREERIAAGGGQEEWE